MDLMPSDALDAADAPRAAVTPTPPDLPAAVVTDDRELSDAELDQVSGGWAASRLRQLFQVQTAIVQKLDDSAKKVIEKLGQ